MAIHRVTGNFSYGDLARLEELINLLPYVEGATRTDLALVNAITNSFTEEFGARHIQLGFPRVVLLVTGNLVLVAWLVSKIPSFAMHKIPLDGQSTLGKRTKLASDLVKQMGINLISVGVGYADQAELSYMASDPKCMKTFVLHDFNGLTDGLSYLFLV